VRISWQDNGTLAMKIFDGRWDGPHGIGRFAREVGRRLGGFERISLSGRPSDAIDPLRLALYLRSAKPKLFVSPGYNAPLGAPCPFVFCVHDLNHLVMSENSNALKRAYYRLIMKPALHRARTVLTVSEFARRSICEWAELPESRVRNVGNGISDAFVPAALRQDDGKQPYFLYVGNHKPHKNFDRLLEAFALSKVRNDFLLMSTGSPTERLSRRMDELKLEGRVKFAGEVSDNELASLYRGATALVLVSLYEGFGLPLIEAMSCGTPVITSNVASMPEVAGNAAIQVNPLDVAAIAESMTQLASDSDLRQRLRMLGIERSRLYSWDITASRVAAAVSACV
jgi:glycosyltransferase involved in cell wall biosynthesis